MSVQGRPIVMRRLFVVAGDATPHPIQEVARVPFDLGRPVWATAHGLVLVSAGNDFYPRVTLESWTGPAVEPPADRTWEDLGRFEVGVPAGSMWIEHADGPRVGGPLLLAPGDYGGCVFRWADDLVPYEDDLDEEAPEQVMEEWLIRFWHRGRPAA
ncbi:hypothetical protein [Streptomyces sp. NPDC049040]|uniref:hypothetical protein n=1 Tax=Streptomyces sp. NPDC049040 TaxID=3365593 RepID=UPI0037179B57